MSRAVALAWLAAWCVASPGQVAVGVRQVEVTVRDVPTSLHFYTEVLGFQLMDRSEGYGDREERRVGVFGAHTESARLRLGDEILELTAFLAPHGRAVPEDARSNDRWFQHVAIIVRDMDRAYEVLRAHRVRHASPAPQTLPAWNPAAGGIRAFYFEDPDGHVLEVLQFPDGKGDPKWHRPGDDLFLGIDHTAIVVADTEASLRFWRDGLGLRVAGTSDNFGIEQERLNNVFGAHLRITTLRGSNGPGVELLEYLTPGGGRPMPTDTRASDLWHWIVTVELAEGAKARAEGQLRAAGGTIVSAAGAAGPIGGPSTDGVLVADPDGHRARVVGAPAIR